MIELEREKENKTEKFFRMKFGKNNLGEKDGKKRKRKLESKEKNVKNAFFQVINSKIFRRAIPWRVLLYWGQI